MPAVGVGSEYPVTKPQVTSTNHGWTREFHLDAGGDLRVSVLTYGGHLVDVSLPDSTGARINMVRRLPCLTDYTNPEVNRFVGALIGRYANRIAGARFTLDGKGHQLVPNDGPNQLHGGPGGFGQVEWTAQTGVHRGDAIVMLSHCSPDGDQGFPGKMLVTATYRLSPDGRLRLRLTASCDAPTPVSLTSHPYWNLDGSGTVDAHRLRVSAAEYLPVTEALIPTGESLPVKNTDFDLRTDVAVGQLPRLDHCYLTDGDATRPVATLVGASGRRLRIHANLPAIQVFTYYPEGQARPAHVCLEPQRPPDAVNQPHLGDVILRPGEIFSAIIDHHFDVAP